MTELTESQRRLVAERLARRPPAARRSADPIPRLDGPPPLSDGQRALLFEHDRHPRSAGYNVCHRYRIRGPLDTTKLGAALLTVVGHHEALHVDLASPRRLLAPDEALAVRIVDTDEAGLESLAELEARTPVALRSGPLLRAVIARLGPDDHGLVLTLHHVSCDAASLAIVWRDMATVYAGGQPPPPAARYGDHAAWRASTLRDEDVDAVVDAVADVPPAVLPYPIHDAPDGFVVREEPLPLTGLPGGVSRPFPALLAVFAGLVQHLTDLDEVVVGVTSTTRDHPDVADTVGYFLNVLAVRIPLDPTRTATELATEADRALAAALDRRHVPYARVAAGVRRRTGTEPARLLLVLEEEHAASLPGCSVETRVVFNGSAAADLTVFVRRDGDAVHLSAEHSGAALGSDDAARLLDAYADLLLRAAAAPDRPFVALGPDAEDATPAAPAPASTVTAEVLGRALVTPDAPAVRCGGDCLTYDGLVRRASAIADALETAGVGRGDRVALLLPRSTDLVAAVLGTHLLGAAYVPIDPAYPAARIDRILSIASPAAAVVPTGDHPIAGPVPTVPLDGVATDGSARRPGPDQDDPAYVIFTSGSTGIPRGVVVRHRQLAASTFARAVEYPTPPDRYLVVSSFGFDSSVAGLFWTLVGGGELVVPTDAEARDPDRLLALAERAAVSHLLVVPTMLGALLERRPDALRDLQQAIVAGESCPPAVARAHAALLPTCRLANEYGPTETTVWATVHHLTDHDRPIVPIGHPIPGASVRVADRWGRTRPVGAAGELLVGGTGVTDGYLGDPEATAARFVTGADGRRRYRTGDLGRRLDDGEYEFLGRVDGQLSIGGHRVEPEEVEAALLDVDGVRAAVVRAEPLLPGDPITLLAGLGADASAVLREAADDPDPAGRLAALLAERTGTPAVLVAHVEGDGLDPQTVRQAVQARLPRALVPARVAVTAALPRTPHGKIDRSALPRSTAAPPPSEAAVEAPQGRVDADVLAAWRAVLGDASLGPDADFFDAGGDSLRAVALMARIEAALATRLPISVLLTARTPRALSALLERPVVLAPHVVELRAATGLPLFVLPTGAGQLFRYAPLLDRLPPELPIYGFLSPGADGISEPLHTVEEHAALFLPELLATQPSGPYRLIGWSAGGLFAYETARLLRAAGHEVSFVGLLDAIYPGFQDQYDLPPPAQRFRAMYGEQGAGAVARQLADGVGRRLRRLRWAVHVRAARTRGRPIDPEINELLMMGYAQHMMTVYRPQPIDAHVVLFAASDTKPERTIEPWSRLLPDLDVVRLEGAHAGPRSLMDPERIEPLAEALIRTLEG